MPKVIIDGIEFVPKAEIPKLTDKCLQDALEELTSMIYFGEAHKWRGKTLNVIKALSPELYELACQDPHAAYERIHGTDDY